MDLTKKIEQLEQSIIAINNKFININYRQLPNSTLLDVFTNMVGFRKDYFVQIILDIVGDVGNGGGDPDLSNYYTIPEVDNLLTYKADLTALQELSTEVLQNSNDIISLNIDITDLQNSLDLKADQEDLDIVITDVENLENIKADNSYVDEQLDLKVDLTYLNEQLLLKANIAYVDDGNRLQNERMDSIDDNNRDTNLRIDALTTRVVTLEDRFTNRIVLRSFNSTASLVLTTTPQALNFLTNSVTNGSGVIRSTTTPTTFTFTRSGYYDSLVKVRGIQTGAGAETLCNVITLINGVSFGTESRGIIDAGVNSFSFLVKPIPINAGDVLSYQIFTSGGGGITLQTTAPDNMCSISITEYK